MRSDSSCAVTRFSNKLSAALFGVNAAPDSPPLIASSAVSSRSPPSCLSAPWLPQQGLDLIDVVDLLVRSQGEGEQEEGKKADEAEPRSAQHCLRAGLNRISLSGHYALSHSRSPQLVASLSGRVSSQKDLSAASDHLPQQYPEEFIFIRNMSFSILCCCIGGFIVKPRLVDHCDSESSL
jgi:hypothetical protein